MIPVARGAGEAGPMASSMENRPAVPRCSSNHRPSIGLGNELREAELRAEREELQGLPRSHRAGPPGA